MNSGVYIKKIRQEKRLSQKELGKKLGVSQQMIGQWETGKANPKIETLRKIADALEVELWEIVELDQMDTDTRTQEIRKMVSLLSPEDLMEYSRLVTEALNSYNFSSNNYQESNPKKRETPATNIPKFFTRDEKSPKDEVYELIHSLIDKKGIDDRECEEVSQQLNKILGAFKNLNKIGKQIAVERICELSLIHKYVFGNFLDSTK